MRVKISYPKPSRRQVHIFIWILLTFSDQKSDVKFAECIHRSTELLSSQSILNWQRGMDLNHRPSAYETDKLPLLYPAIVFYTGQYFTLRSITDPERFNCSIYPLQFYITFIQQRSQASGRSFFYIKSKFYICWILPNQFTCYVQRCKCIICFCDTRGDSNYSYITFCFIRMIFYLPKVFFNCSIHPIIQYYSSFIEKSSVWLMFFIQLLYH